MNMNKVNLSLIVFCLFVIMLLYACSNNQGNVSNKKMYKIAVAGFFHETCTFCPGDEPDIKDWTYQGPPYKGEDVFTSRTYLKGFSEQSSAFNDVNLIGLSTPRGVFGGISRTWNKQEVFDHFVGLMIEDLKEVMPVDGIYLALHGAMAVRGIDHPEAEIAKRFREVVGPNIPIVATFDLHGNEDEKFLEQADGLFAVKRYPHYDEYYQGERAARYLHQLMRGTYKPTKSVRTIPILTATVLQWTGQSPMMNIMERARRWEDRVPGAYVNVFLGFPWADVKDVGTSVHIMTNDNQLLADEIADDMAAYLWRTRKDWSEVQLPQPVTAVEQAKNAISKGEVPVVLADYWDRTGDGTWTLKELIRQEVDNVIYATITDVNLLEKIWEKDYQLGESIDIDVGGYTGEQAGKAVRVRGKLLWKGKRWEYEKVAVIEFGKNNLIVLTPGYKEIRTPEQLRFGPIEPDKFQVFVLKSRVHFRRGFDETGYAPSIILVDAPGKWFGTMHLDALPYNNISVRNFYPFEAVAYGNEEQLISK